MVVELPKGVESQVSPTVSGTWYLGILKGSTAVRAGAQLIKQLTSPDLDVYKLNRGIGMPVRKALYDAARSRTGLQLVERPLLECRQQPLYADQIMSIADVLANYNPDDFKARVLRSRCPFFRETIRQYRSVSPLLMRMMVEAARIAVFNQWLWRRDESFAAIETELESLVRRAELRCRIICK
jgi:hypothetical protein